MSIIGRKRKHGAKMQRRRDEKAAKRVKYAALAGTSKKKKRQRGQGKRSSLKKAHAMADCGNAGCMKCYPRENRKS